MPATSEKQQRAMGIALAAKRGEIKKSKLSPSIRKMMNSMSEEQLKEFASTKHADIKKSASFKLYSNQEIYNYLIKSASTQSSNYLVKEFPQGSNYVVDSEQPFQQYKRFSPREKLRNGEFWGYITRQFSDVGRGMGDNFNKWMGFSSEDIHNLVYKYLSPILSTSLDGEVPPEVELFTQDMSRLINALDYLNKNTVSGAYGGYPLTNVQQAITTLYQNVSKILKQKPELAKYIDNAYSSLYKDIPDLFPRAVENVPQLKSSFTATDPETGKKITLSPQSIHVLTNNVNINRATDPKDEAARIREINELVGAGEITPEEGKSRITQIKYEGIQNAISKFRNTYSTLNRSQRDEQLNAVMSLLDQNATSNYSISDDQRAGFIKQIAELSSRFGLPKTNQRIMNNVFGDLSTNPLLKYDNNAVDNLLVEAKKVFPYITKDDLLDKIYTKEDGTVDYDAKNKRYTRMVEHKYKDLSTNPLYKADRNAARKAFLDWQKYDPSIKYDAFLDKIYTKEDGTVDYDAKNKFFTDMLKPGLSKMYAYYDAPTGTFYYGNSTKMLKSKPMSEALAIALRNVNNDNRYDVYNQLLEGGFTEDESRRLALGAISTGSLSMYDYVGNRYTDRPHSVSWVHGGNYDKNMPEDIKNGLKNKTFKGNGFFDAYKAFINKQPNHSQSPQQKVFNNQSKLTASQRGQANTNNQTQPSKPAYQEAFDRYNNVINNYKKAPRPPLMY